MKQLTVTVIACAIAIGCMIPATINANFLLGVGAGAAIFLVITYWIGAKLAKKQMKATSQLREKLYNDYLE